MKNPQKRISFHAGIIPDNKIIFILAVCGAPGEGNIVNPFLPLSGQTYARPIKQYEYRRGSFIFPPLINGLLFTFAAISVLCFKKSKEEKRPPPPVAFYWP